MKGPYTTGCLSSWFVVKDADGETIIHTAHAYQADEVARRFNQRDRLIEALKAAWNDNIHQTDSQMTDDTAALVEPVLKDLEGDEK